MISRSRQPLIAGQKRSIKRFCQGNVCRIVRADILAQLPDPLEESEVRVSNDREIGKKSQRDCCAIGRDNSARNKSSNCVHDLNVEQVRRMQRIFVLENKSFDADPGQRAEHDLNESGSVDNNHLVFRSARITSAADSGRTIGSSCCKRLRISSIVGLSAISRISFKR